MSDDRFKHFRHLERPRQPGGAAPRDPSPGTEGRFGALEERRQGAEGSAGVADGHLGRFRPAAERPLELAPAEAGELPFVRCAACQVDHNRSAATCSNCGADLRTREQRAFNALLAEERRAQATAEAAQVAELERAREEAAAGEAQAKREMAETLAREVGEAERRRLDAELGGGFGAPPGRGGWGSGWGSGEWGDAGWGRGRHGAIGLGGWLLSLLFRFLFGGRRWR
ncbi:MAG TPA: hypothetical protein VLT47_04405 [Anaeromyxobacteraceae bacterium]|nr:hypothetical protein [Anaeromyxobacteraceae bacterium]